MEKPEPDTLYYALTLASSSTILLLTAMTLGMHIPEDERLGYLYRIRKYLAFAYFAIGTNGLITFFAGKEVKEASLVTAFMLVILSFHCYYNKEDNQIYLHWINRRIYNITAISILASSSQFHSFQLYAFFSVIYTTYLAYIVYKLYNNLLDLKFSSIAIVAEEEEGDRAIEAIEREQSFEPEQDPYLKNALETWVNEKKFTQKDAGVEDIARQLDTDLSSLRHYFKVYVGCSVRTWRLELRIREAQHIMETQPQLTTSQVCEMVGFGDRSDFHRQFSKITGMSPADYKESLHTGLQ